MYRYSKWLIALALVAVLAPAETMAAEETASLGGSVEVGAAGVQVDDDSSRLYEYSNGRTEDGVTGYGKMDLDVHDSRGVVLEAEAEVNTLQSDTRDADYKVKADINRFIRAELSYGAFEHKLDHDRLDYLDAAVVRGGMNKSTGEPVAIGSVTPDLVPAFVLHDPDGSTGSTWWGSNTGDYNTLAADFNDDETIIQTGGASLYGEDLTPNADFEIQHRELKGRVEVPVPSIPGLTLDVGYRHEEREGTEQAIGMSKCASCHITGDARRVDEVTQDVSAGATGKFGLLTVRYEFTDRQFTNRAAPSLYQYDPVQKPGQPFDNTIFENRMGYDYLDGEIPYGVDPDSEKQSHVVKARVDLPKEASVVGSYVRADIESAKTDGVDFTVNRDTLQTTYDGYGLRMSKRFGKNLKLNLRGRMEETEGDSRDVSYTPISTGGGAGLAGPVTYEQDPLEAVASRDVATVGLDAVYRLARKTTLRLGGEFEEEDREDEHFGKTETLTVKGRINTRIGRDLSARLGLTYQDIDNPFHNPTAADVPLTENVAQSKAGISPAYIVGGNSRLYGTSFYDARTADLTNQPDTVYEGKFSTTWSPSARLSATFNYRYKDEEAELNKYTWEQTTHAPGLSLWYAPADKVFLTLAANYLDQRSDTAFCQGFYDG